MTAGVPDDLFLLFFKNATAALLHLDGNGVMEKATNDENTLDTLATSRRYILNVQQTVLQKSLDDFYQDFDDDDDPITIQQAKEHLGQLGSTSTPPPKLIREAMEGMNEAAKLALCKVVLWCEYSMAASPQKYKHNLQGSGDLDRTRLLEYFGLCEAALKLYSVKKFMAEGGSLFEDVLGTPINLVDNSELLLPQTRLEYVQQLLAQAMGWDPVFLTKELQHIFVEKDDSNALVHDKQVNSIFQNLVHEMQVAICTASLQMKKDQDLKMMNDLQKGGATRVVSVQYSEFEITPDGKKKPIAGSNSAPPKASTMTEEEEDASQTMTEEEKKKTIRLASETAVLQQEILGELLSLPEHERNNRLEEAKQAHQDFMKQVMTLPPGPERMNLLLSVDAPTSRKLAMHKLWKGMLEANGGKPPQMARKRNH